VLYRFATAVTLDKRQQVVVPLTIGMRAEVRLLPSLTNDADIHLFAGAAIDGIERSGFSVNAGDRVLARYPPGGGARDIANVSNVFVRAHVMGLVDASDFMFRHGISLPYDPRRGRIACKRMAIP
jgi:hypothetical protein